MLYLRFVLQNSRPALLVWAFHPVFIIKILKINSTRLNWFEFFEEGLILLLQPSTRRTLWPRLTVLFSSVLQGPLVIVFHFWTIKSSVTPSGHHRDPATGRTAAKRGSNVRVARMSPAFTVNTPQVIILGKSNRSQGVCAAKSKWGVKYCRDLILGERFVYPGTHPGGGGLKARYWKAYRSARREAAVPAAPCLSSLCHGWGDHLGRGMVPRRNARRSPAQTPPFFHKMMWEARIYLRYWI